MKVLTFFLATISVFVWYPSVLAQDGQYANVEFTVTGELAYLDEDEGSPGDDCDFRLFGPTLSQYVVEDLPRLVVEDAAGVIVAVHEISDGKLVESKSGFTSWTCETSFTLSVPPSAFYRLIVGDRIDRPMPVNELLGADTYLIHLGESINRG
jgi:hypothetical protein